MSSHLKISNALVYFIDQFQIQNKKPIPQKNIQRIINLKKTHRERETPRTLCRGKKLKCRNQSKN